MSEKQVWRHKVAAPYDTERTDCYWTHLTEVKVKRSVIYGNVISEVPVQNEVKSAEPCNLR